MQTIDGLEKKLASLLRELPSGPSGYVIGRERQAVEAASVIRQMIEDTVREAARQIIEARQR